MGHEPTPSRAAIKGHPVHPMLIPLPIGLLTAALVADTGYWVDGSRTWALAAVWLLGGVVVTGALAGAAGLVDFMSINKIREHRTAKRHALGNGLVLLLTSVSFLIRLDGVEEGVLPWGILLTALSAAIVTYTGWLGGELSYKHMFGVNPEQMGPASPAIGSKAHH